MRYRPLQYLLLFIFLLTGAGCEKYINYVNSPEFEQKLVVTSFISPSDTVSRIFVSSNQPLYSFSEKLEDPGDIMGTISDGITEIELDTTSFGLSFSHDKMPVVSGRTYTLKISCTKGLNAEAKATVPLERDILIKVDTLSQDRNEYMPGVELGINIELTDYPGEKNYYNVIGKFSGYKPESESGGNSFFPRYWFEYIDDTDASDDNRIRLDTWITQSLSNYDSAFITVYLMNTEKSYYLYHTSLHEYDYGDNPFSEAKPVYSNIDGGLGIFTSYTIDTLVFRLK
jgi:hypothetical protein